MLDVPALLTGRLTDAAYAAGWALVRALPEPVGARAVPRAAPTSPRGAAAGRSTGCARNLARVAPDADLDR